MMKDLPPPLRSIDKRIQKSKRQLLDAFVALIIERGYGNVTVQDIIDRAGVGRSTFYSHFENKEQLLRGPDMARLLVENKIISGSNTDINFLRLYAHVRENHALAKELFTGETLVMMRDHIQNIMAYALKHYLNGRLRENKIEKKMLDIMVEAVAAALTSMLINWSLSGMELSVEVMAEKSGDLVSSVFV
jgi:AcrR family transcriptional regulator